MAAGASSATPAQRVFAGTCRQALGLLPGWTDATPAMANTWARSNVFTASIAGAGADLMPLYQQHCWASGAPYLQISVPVTPGVLVSVSLLFAETWPKAATVANKRVMDIEIDGVIVVRLRDQRHVWWHGVSDGMLLSDATLERAARLRIRARTIPVMPQSTRPREAGGGALSQRIVERLGLAEAICVRAQLARLNVVAEVGLNTALVKTFDVTSTGGEVVVRLLSVKQNAMLAGIEVAERRAPLRPR